MFNLFLYLGIFDLISKMLEKNPDQRIKLADIAQHPWMRKFGSIESLEERFQCALI